MAARRPVPHVLDETPEGERVRARTRPAARPPAIAWRGRTRCNTHLGYRYDDSPICVPDGPPPPEPEDARDYRQSSHPGGRAPHAWLADGRSTLDLFGRGFTLLRFGRMRRTPAPLAAAPRARGVPLEIVALDEPDIGALYERKLVLVRPDGHVAWRGDALPADAAGADRSRARRAAHDGPLPATALPRARLRPKMTAKASPPCARKRHTEEPP